MTPEEQAAEIQQAFSNNETMLEEMELTNTIGKIANLVVPRKEGGITTQNHTSTMLQKGAQQTVVLTSNKTTLKPQLYFVLAFDAAE